jgi:hypothetical protein
MPISFNEALKSSAAAESSAVGKYEGGSYVPDLARRLYVEAGFRPRNSRSAAVDAEVRR